MFIDSIAGSVIELTPNNQTRFQCTVELTVPIDAITSIEPGRLIATENLFTATREKRYTILQLVNAFPIRPAEKRQSHIVFSCHATPMGMELIHHGKQKGFELLTNDTFPTFSSDAWVLDDEMTMNVIHQIAPESRAKENGTRIDVGAYRTNPEVLVGLDATTLIRGNTAIISTRTRARTTITNNLVSALLSNESQPLHIVYCDVNNSGTLSLASSIHNYKRSSILCLNDTFVPSTVFAGLKNLNDRTAHKRAVLDYLDMMILPSVLESRRQDFSFGISNWMRSNKLSIYRPNEQTVDQFISDIGMDILDGVDEEVEEYITELMNGLSETYRGERFNEKNTKEIQGMVDEFSQDSRSHNARKTLNELKTEIQSAFESYSKDIPSNARKSIRDIVNELNDGSTSSLTVVQGQKTTDILRFIDTLSQKLVEERSKRLKVRVPVLFIFNNIDEYVTRGGNGYREPGSDRFQEVINTLLSNGRRHGLGFCLTLENAGSLDPILARKIHSYFIGPIAFAKEPAIIANLLNLSEDLLQPAVNYENGDFLIASADSPYHRRVPLPVRIKKNTELLHAFLDELVEDAERRRQEYYAQEEDRRKRSEKEREERKKRDAEKREAERLETEKREAEEREASKHRDEESSERQDLPIEDFPADTDAQPDEKKKPRRSTRGGTKRPSSRGKGSAKKSSVPEEKPKTVAAGREPGTDISAGTVIETVESSEAVTDRKTEADAKSRADTKTGKDEDTASDNANEKDSKTARPRSKKARGSSKKKQADEKDVEQSVAEDNTPAGAVKDTALDSLPEEKPKTRGKRQAPARRGGGKKAEQSKSNDEELKGKTDPAVDSAPFKTKKSSTSTLIVEDFNPDGGKKSAQPSSSKSTNTRRTRGKKK